MKTLVMTEDVSTNSGILCELKIGDKVVSKCRIDRSDNMIYCLETFPEFQRQGYAQTMLKIIFSMFPNQCLQLEAYKSNKPAVKLYKKMGFKTVATEIEGWGSDKEKILLMKINTSKNIANPKVEYGFFCDGVKILFDNENDRNEMALSFWGDWSHYRWMKAVNLWGRENDKNSRDYYARSANYNVETFRVVAVE